MTVTLFGCRVLVQNCMLKLDLNHNWCMALVWSANVELYWQIWDTWLETMLQISTWLASRKHLVKPKGQNSFRARVVWTILYAIMLFWHWNRNWWLLNKSVITLGIANLLKSSWASVLSSDYTCGHLWLRIYLLSQVLQNTCFPTFLNRVVLVT